MSSICWPLSVVTRPNTGSTPSERAKKIDGRKSKNNSAPASIKTMSKAEYTLLAAVVGFYILLFAYLLTRALAGLIRAWLPATPKIKKVSRVVARNRAWTHAVWRASVTPELERGKPSRALTA
jgi:hypothetical protein